MEMTPEIYAVIKVALSILGGIALFLLGTIGAFIKWISIKVTNIASGQAVTNETLKNILDRVETYKYSHDKDYDHFDKRLDVIEGDVKNINRRVGKLE